MLYRKKLPLLLVLTALSLSVFFYVAYAVTHKGSIQTSVFSYDRSVQTWVRAHTTPDTSKLMLSITYAANPSIIIIATVAIVFILLLVHEQLLVAFFAGSLAIGAVLSQYVKQMIQRPRPIDFLFDISQPGYSFPSAHALIATVFYGFIGYCLLQIASKQWQKIVIGFLTTAFIFLIGFSRVVLGVHWISDVLGGWMLGFALLMIIIIIFDRVKNRMYGPVRIPHGIALILVFIIITAASFSISYYYVTHLASVRSIITTHH